jgi:hypothetical protein
MRKGGEGKSASAILYCHLETDLVISYLMKVKPTHVVPDF